MRQDYILLRIIAGLEHADAGEVWISGRRVDGLEPIERKVAMVFQSYALYPHMTAYNNQAFSMKLRKVPKEEIRTRVMQAARTLGLENLLDRYPRQLSGGQRQRVSMGRAIVRSPEVFLFDEPLSNLDAQLRVHMRGEIKDLHHALGTTSVYVTHDQVEAMTMGDRIVVLRDGRAPAGGHAVERVRPAGEPLRRRLHRVAADEPRAGHAGGRRGWNLVVPPRRARRSRLRDGVSRDRGLEKSGSAASVVVGVAPRGSSRASPRALRPAARRCHHGGHGRPRRGARRGAARASSASTRRSATERQAIAAGAPAAGMDEVAHHGTREGSAVLRDVRAALRRSAPATSVDCGAWTPGRLHFFDPETEQAIGT